MQEWRTAPSQFAERLRFAAHNVGFFTLRHRLPDGVAEGVMAASREFFALSADQKSSMDYSRSAAFRGYMAVGVENTAGAPDVREQVELAAESPPSPPDVMPPYERLRGPNQWPEAMPSLRPTLGAFTAHMLALSAELTAALCAALRVPDGSLDPLFGGAPHWQLKLARYPPVPPPADSVGVGAHTDSGFLTLLLQDDVGGLQVQPSDGRWVDVPPAGAGVLVCNLGEVAELASAGYLKATPHRVLSSGRERVSVPFFYNPRLEAVVRPLALPAALEWEREEGERWRNPANELIAEYGANAFKSLARSHPTVLRRWHADLRVDPQTGRVDRA